MYAPLAVPPKRQLPRLSSVSAWLYFLAQISFIVGIDLADELTHGKLSRAAVQLAQQHAVHIMDFERAHGFWIEPGIQEFFERTHHLLGLTLGWHQMVLFFDALYGFGHVGITFVFALFIFLRRSALFPFLRDVFLFTTLITLVVYRIYPLAPPRLAGRLLYDGRPYHFIDAVFGSGNAVNLSFDQFASMPSLHMAWALIVGLSLAWTLRPAWARLMALAYPPLMLATVIVTGNHYITDALGSILVLVIAVSLAVLAQQRRMRGASPLLALHRLQQLRYR
jgi:hypothetical protein